MSDRVIKGVKLDYPRRPCCAYCGSANVVQDAWACWIEAEHEWALQEVFDHGECLDCGESEIEWGEP